MSLFDQNTANDEKGGDPKVSRLILYLAITITDSYFSNKLKQIKTID
jgi:hypothetical protein